MVYAFTKAIQLSPPSPLDNLGLENANVITVMLQVMEMAQKGRFFIQGFKSSPYFQVPNHFPMFSSKISNVHHTLLEIVLKFLFVRMT